ncbi:DUF1360 domain-containing protein [Streptomyces xiamenensis]|uniref:DUF1360 domain-containing protein n=1 Tax=Streptomyces xiamenensis TaxID=408015 RepID=UPI0037CCE276
MSTADIYLIVTGVLSIGAAARLTRLVVDDTITAPIRDAITTRGDTRGGTWAWASKLVSCTWCASIWVTAGVGAAHWLAGDTRLYLYVAAGLTIAYIVPLARDWLDAPPPVRQVEVAPLQVTHQHVITDRRR